MPALGDRRRVGRYVLGEEIGRGGMAVVYRAELLGEAGFSRTVAVKRLLPLFAGERELVRLLVNEARVASHLRHPNIVATIDSIAEAGDLMLVMEYVDGASLAELLRDDLAASRPVPVPIAARIVLDILAALDTAHRATDEDGRPLDLVHRDVSPQNVLVGRDGIARVADFGIAKARSSPDTTAPGEVRGKIAYMASEQLMGKAASVESDLYAAGVILWEMLTGRRLFAASSSGAAVAKVLAGARLSPSELVPSIPAELDALVMKAIAVDREARFRSAREMSLAVEDTVRPAHVLEMVEWVRERLVSRPRAPDSFATATIPPIAERDEALVPASPVPAPRRRSRRAALAVVFVGSVSVLAALASWQRHQAPARGVAVTAAAAPPATVSAVAQAETPVSTTTTSSSEPEPTPRSIEPAAAPLANSTRGTRGARTRGAAPPPTKRPSPCDPPTYRDANGIVRVKIECL